VFVDYACRHEVVGVFCAFFRCAASGGVDFRYVIQETFDVKHRQSTDQCTDRIAPKVYTPEISQRSDGKQ
jgi:hypothetical protein